MKNALMLLVLVSSLIIGVPLGLAAQDNQKPADGFAPPSTEHLRIRVRFMAGFGKDDAQSSALGFENQARVGYAIIELFGRIDGHFSYRVEINPVNETQPLPACGETGYFFPNAVQNLGPPVVCENDGRMRVDDYRFLALDLINQQGPIRQAYLAYENGGFGVRFGRFVLPIGFGWEEAGSFTSKDAPHIQRINAEANFGTMVTLAGPRAKLDAAAIIGDGNRFHDYDYFYFLDGSLDSNSALSGLVSLKLKPAEALDVRFAYKFGYTGSKVERLPNFYASKRNDRARVVSARYQPTRYVGLFGEYASYTWGLTETSAELLGFKDTSPVKKQGYYAGVDLSYPVAKAARVGIVTTREELSRDDALVRLLAGQGLYGVRLGEKERSTVYRLYVDFNRYVTAALYMNNLDNPFPWISGITAVSGPKAFQEPDSNKWGLAVRFTLP